MIDALPQKQKRDRNWCMRIWFQSIDLQENNPSLWAVATLLDHTKPDESKRS
jgi:hypothetical protein